MSRLKLDFSIVTANDRKLFVDNYLKELRDPTEAELETIANYILYGETCKDEKGKRITAADEAGVVIPVKNSPWQRKGDESLEALMERAAETGNPIEKEWSTEGHVVPLKISRTVFDRRATRRELQDNEFLLNTFERLWDEIDKVEFLVTVYDLMNGKRTKAVREPLVSRLKTELREKLIEQARGLTNREASKMKKLLVELRTQQYSLRDSYAVSRMPAKGVLVPDEEFPLMKVLPAGPWSPQAFPLKWTSESIKGLVVAPREEGVGALDFRNVEHVAMFVYALPSLIENAMDPLKNYEEREYVKQLVETFNYYRTRAALEPLQADLLSLKSAQWRNEDIARLINKKYNTNYSLNYISTIFRAKCCGGITVAAIEHEKILHEISQNNISALKKCNLCNEYRLRSPEYFVRKSRAADGFSGRCKRCDKELRKKND